jgi:aldehyde dehydrogenase (NAD+)
MTIQDILSTMDYGTAPESAAEALGWIAAHDGAFGHFINGRFTDPGEGFETRNPATGDLLATITQATQADVDAAVAAARAAQPDWAALGGHKRARRLYALARLLQKHARLFAVLETLDNGKPIRESRDIDIPLAQRHFYYHAGMAQLMDEELSDRVPLGVCGQIIPWNFPLLMLAWKIAPAIAMGNAVVLKPAEYTPLTALLFGQICQEAGLPAGVVNIVTGDGAVGEMIVAAEVDKVAFTGSTNVGRAIRKATAGTGKSLTLELGGKSPYIVFEDADLDSAVEGLVDAIWFNQGQVCCAGSRLLVQEGIANRFYDKLKARMDRLRVGDPLDKSIDVGSLVDPVQHQAVSRLVAEGGSAGEVYQSPQEMPGGCFYPPTLITGLAPSDLLMQEEIFGPVLVSTTFRTPAEAVELANNTRYGLAASVWSENVNLALDVAPKLAAGVVWVNATNLFDAAAGFGGVRESGFGREGGWEGLLAYTKPAKAPARATAIAPCPAPADPSPDDPLDRTAKMYVGGKQARPDGGYSRAIWSPGGALLGHVGEGNRKDIRNAVEAATKAAGWARTTGHLRAQILFYIAENLSARAGEFATRLDAMTGDSGGAAEVEAAIDLLFTHAAWADKHDGATKAVPLRGLAVAVNEPVGVIGAICPPDRPLLGLIAAMAPAIAMGNRVVLVPSEAFPLAATDFYQVLETSDVPAGVVNIVTGAPAAVSADIASHLDVDAVWNLATPDLDAALDAASAGNLKRVWNSASPTAGSGRDALAQATEIKTIWVPYGE